MALIDEAREKLDDVVEATPDEVRDMARQAARSARQAAEDAAKLAAMAAGAAAAAARTGHEAFGEARAEGQPMTDAARVATRKAVAVGLADDDGDPTDAHQEEYTVHDDEDD
jgi:hypothetical protein